MIYFLDNSLQLQKIVTSKNINSAVHEHELNGLIRGNIELDLSYANKFLVLGIDHVGYYYKGEFYLHKIQRVEYDHVNESVKVVFRHIFFEDMLFGPIIKDVRPKNQDAVTILRQTIEANTRWQIVMTDVTGTLSTNFYWQVPYEVIEFVNKNFRVDMFPKILFDGKNINGFQLHVKNASSSEVKQRIPFGSRVLDLKYEEDFSEIVTKLVGHGKGEEVGDGYGRRINFSEINFNRNGVKSPVGSVYMEDPSVTNTYGNDGQTPREGRVVFEDIENPSELAEATYHHYLDVSRPKMLFTADVADIGDVSIGDSVLIVRREYDVYFKARIHKLSVNLLNPEDAQVELGDYEHFKESKVERKSREKNNRIQKQLSDRITRLKREANDLIDGEFSQALAEFEQNLIDQQAQIEADRVNMTNLIEGTRADFTDNLNAEITQTKEYAEQQAQEKADEVRTDLGAVTSGHQAMIDSLQDNVMSIDDFLGDKTVGLNEMLINERMWFEEKLNNVDTWHYNMLRGTRFDEPEQIKMWNGSIKTDEEVPYYEYNTNPYQGWVEFTEEIQFEAGQQYTLSFDAQTLGVKKMDYTFIIASPDDGGSNMQIHREDIQDSGTNNNIFLFSQYRRYWIKFTPDRNILGTIRIGANLVNNERGYRPFKIRLPYLTTTDNTRWLYHQLDSSQNIEEITRRVMQLEYGFEEVVTRTEYDFKTGEIDGTIKTVLETVDKSSLTIQNHEDWILTNGASIERTVDGFDSKAWLTDIHNPNMIPHSRFLDPENIGRWADRAAPLMTKHGDEWLQVRSTNSLSLIGVESPKIPDKIISGETYTISWEAFFNISSSRINHDFSYMFVLYSNNVNQGLPRPTLKETKNVTVEGTVRTVYVYELTFTANNSDNNAAILFGTNCNPGEDIRFFMRYPKLEVGTVSTPYFNAFSNLTQRADEMMLAVQGIDTSGFLSQSDIIIRPEYAQMGSQRLDGNDIGSFLRVSPTGIDAVAEAMRLSGDLYVEGDITALAVNAIEGNFARLFANQLTANVITADHIQVGTQLVDKLFATSARIDELITKTHFVNEMHVLTLNVVELNASQIRSRLLTANVIEAEWLKSGTALLDRVFSSTAMFERMMAKSGFVTTLNTVTIDTDQITIRRSDGGVLVSQGMQRFGSAIITKPFPGSEVTFDGTNYVTTSRGAQTFERAYGEHSGRWANFSVRVGLRWDSDDASSEIGIVIRPGTMPSGVSVGTHVETVMAYRGSMESHTISVRLPVPTFGATSWTLEFYRIGDNSPNYLLVRSERCWTSA